MDRTDLWLLRHGETAWSRTGQHTGRTDLPLEETGRRQARDARALLSGETFSLVLTSPLQRAVETSELAGVGEAAIRTDDLREWDYGDYEGLTTAQILATRPGWNLWSDGVPGGESPAEVGRRADRVIERARSSSGTVLLVAHGHILRVLAARWIELPPAGGGHLPLGTAAIGVLGWEHTTPGIVRWGICAADGAAAGS